MVSIPASTPVVQHQSGDEFREQQVSDKCAAGASRTCVAGDNTNEVVVGVLWPSILPHG